MSHTIGPCFPVPCSNRCPISRACSLRDCRKAIETMVSPSPTSVITTHFPTNEKKETAMTIFPSAFLWGLRPRRIRSRTTTSTVTGGLERACQVWNEAGTRLTATTGMRGHAPAGGSLNSYRLGIEWARIEPTPGSFSRAELAHYRRMIETATGLGFRGTVEFPRHIRRRARDHVRTFARMVRKTFARSGWPSIPFGQRATAP